MSNIIDQYNKQKDKNIPNRLKLDNKTPIDRLVESHNKLQEEQEQKILEKDIEKIIEDKINKAFNDVFDK